MHACCLDIWHKLASSSLTLQQCGLADCTLLVLYLSCLDASDCGTCLQVCVPFTAADAPTFDPDAVPTVSQLLDELSAERQAREGQPGSAAIEKGEGWRHTSLAPCMTEFVQSFLQPLCAAGRDELGSKAREVAAQPTLAW